ncbi:glutathione S-transferase family protein [Rhodobacteraceae bacterium KMM 6894]|nr:glutathione S-transferase family protein [Rhodobacteraceae bacterium KMM 6894]
MKLYYVPGTISVASVLAMDEAGLDVTLHKVSFKDGEQTTPAYRQINPKGRVPVLEVGGMHLTETGAILEYIATVAPDAGLMPTDSLEAAHVRSVMFYLASTMHVNHAHGRRAGRWATQQSSLDDMAAKVTQNMTKSAQYVEDHCLKGPFVNGDQFSIADPYLFAICNWLEADKVDVAAFPRILAFRAAMEDRPSVRTARAAGILKR